MKVQRYPIGTTFKSGGKCPKVCTVTDYLRVINFAGDVVKHYYQATHKLGDITVTDYEVPESTITRGLIKC